ncbi:MAG TPA: cytochrome C oxidase subunit IV family protein [Longimicrobiales bacterium]|nr:cytochrome C oxidase subunit IV family protein [Longimicrobiales bacterium]
MADSTAHEVAHSDHHHPTWKTYVIVGAILTFITAIEVAIFYIPSMAGVIVPVLLVLSAVKFLIVVLWYMHLKFDSGVFSRVFFAPLFLAMLVVLGMIILFKVLPRFDI